MNSQQIKDELSNYQLDVEETKAPSSTKIIEHERIEGTPFTAIKVDEEWKLALGKYIMTEGAGTYDDLKQWVETHKWEVVLNMIIAVIDSQNKMNETLNTSK